MTMRFVYTFIFMVIFTFNSMSQSPQLFNYQSVIRDGGGSLVSNQDIALKMSIVEGYMYGTTVYCEVHYVTTNQYGLISVKIGNGSVDFGNFRNIDWGESDHFINIAVDLDGGNDFQELGTSQLVSVPYALYAETSGDSYLEKNHKGHLFYNNGRLGIGTNDPQKALHIRRVTDNGRGIGQAQILVEADGQSSSTIYLGYYPNDQYNVYEGSVWSISSHKDNGDFAIGEEVDHIAGGNGNETRLLIQKETGNLGIGVSQPKRKLHISSAMRLEPQETPPDDPEMGDMYFGTDGYLHLYNGIAWNKLNMTQE